MTRAKMETVTREVVAQAEKFQSFLRASALDQAEVGRVCTARDYREAAHVIARLIDHIEALSSR